MAFIIGGHVRSGTTMMRNICNAHPDVCVTMELGSFRKLGAPFGPYARTMLQTLWRHRNRSFLVQEGKASGKVLLQSHAFVLRYLRELRGRSNGVVTVPAIEGALREVSGGRARVGDKRAHYVYELDDLTTQDGLSIIVIYRDCRDVAASVKERVNGEWKGRPFVKSLDTMEKIGHRWIEAMTAVERHRDRLFVLRYEDVVQQPERAFERIGACLDIDPAGFPLDRIESRSVGNYRKRLSEQEVARLLDVTGPMMERFGYL